MGIAHKIYTFLGGKEGSFLQKKWSYFCKKRDYRKRQKVLHQNGLELLQKFKEACQECNVDYWVEFGTLLGAVRNKSFIPHDIDIDVAMMKDSYSAELEQRLTSKGFVKDHHFDRLIVQSGERTTSEHTFHYKGLAIDIFLVFTKKIHISYMNISFKKAVLSLRRFRTPLTMFYLFPPSRLTILN